MWYVVQLSRSSVHTTINDGQCVYQIVVFVFTGVRKRLSRKCETPFSLVELT
jgi:hypothetical protein